MLVSSLLVVGALGATAPAYADEPTPPTSAPTPAASESPEPEATPTAEATEAPEAADEVVVEEVDEPVAGATSVTYSGYVTEIADRNEEDVTSEFTLFRVVGLGYLRVDLTGVDAVTPDGKLKLKLEVPEGLSLEDDAFAALADYSRTVSPIVALEAIATKATSKSIGQAYIAPAVHKIFAVLVTPTNVAGTAPNAQQTPAKVQAAVDHVSDYWSDQSAGKITFELQGVVPWYKSAFNCNIASDANSDNLWAEGAAKAATGPNQIGYEDAPNNHLVLIFPSGVTTECGGAIGLGTGSYSVNSGGLVWSVGTDAPQEKSTLAHELGHNMGFGHANWLDCASATPSLSLFGLSGCTEKEYGDVFDVMGFGVPAKSGGSSSSPNAIRTGIWSTSSYTNVAQGTSTHTIKAIGTNAGKRALVIEDTNGINYFVELRTFTGHDAQYSGGYGACTTAATACVSNTPGVRVLKLEQQVGSGGGSYKGYGMDGTHLIGRTVGGVKRVDYKAGEFYSTSSGLNITVNSISGDSASITVKRPKNGVTASYVDIYPSITHDGEMRVGDVWTANIASGWEADSYTYQWSRSGKKISGATKANYVLTAADKGKNIAVKVTGKSGKVSKSATDPGYPYNGYGPIKAGVLNTGTVAIDATAATFKAAPKSWGTPGTSFKYQWLRNGSAIKGATKSTYVPSTSDNGKSLSVKLSASKSGYGAVSAVTSAAKNYTVTATGSLVINGTPKVAGSALTVSNLTYSTTAGVIASPTRTYQWYASGKAISGATNASYTPTGAVAGKALTVRVTGRTSGFASHTATSTTSAKVLKGTLAGNHTGPDIVKSGTTSVVLTAIVAPTSISELGTKTTYQWFRSGKAIKKATKSVYTLTSSDYATLTSVRAIVTKTGYDTVTLTNTPASYSIVATPTVPLITGNLAAGQTLTVGTGRTYTNSPTALAYQWYRDGKAISGQTASTYVTNAVTDKGKAISARIVASRAGFQPSTATSAKTPKLGVSYFTGSAATITKAAETTVLTANPNVVEVGAKATYQWYRGATAIKKATKVTYKPVSADAGKPLSVKITVSKVDYTTVVKASAAVNVSVQASGVPVLSDTTPAVGNVLSAALPTYSTQPGGAFSPAPTDVTYQWLASGKAISGAKSATYTVSSKYKGKTIAVKVTVKKTGWLTTSTTSVASAKVTAS